MDRKDVKVNTLEPEKRPRDEAENFTQTVQLQLELYAVAAGWLPESESSVQKKRIDPTSLKHENLDFDDETYDPITQEVLCCSLLA